MAGRWRRVAMRAAVVVCAYWSGSITLPARTAAQPDVVEIAAERFSFTPSEIRVKAGTTVVIRLHSEDTDHGFKIPGTDIDVRIPKRNRGTIDVTFDAVKAGRYTFQCSHVCGAGHSFMRGEIVVTE